MSDEREDPREIDRELSGPPTFGELSRQLGYTMFPVNYTDETSTTDELLLQLVLEQRATRTSVYVAAFVIPIVCMITVILAVLVAS